MRNMERLYLTTTLPYVNAEPHIGFALELLQADAIARYARICGKEVFFNTGTDEHGQKIFQKAEEEGQTTKEYVDHYAKKFAELKDLLDLDYDAFIRTTDEKHISAAKEIWKRCLERGDIYKKAYKGLYCVGDEMFLKESDLVDGRCPNHPNLTPVEIEEENYFFALSKYKNELLQYLGRKGVIVPEWRREEAISFVKGGLEDFSISRDATRMNWGIPVPGDDSQVMYVWFDALTNYISTLDWPNGDNFKKFWDEGMTLQLAGKDQVRFQSIMWQAMLISAGVKTTDQIFYHGFITSGGQKMSKSLGNVINPLDLVSRYGMDATRYLLLRHVHPFEDTDITIERLDEWYNAHLANGIGNLVSRVMKMYTTYSAQYGPHNFILDVRNVKAWDSNKELKGHMEKYELNEALDYIWKLIGLCDNKIAAGEPFKLIKTDMKKAAEMIVFLTGRVYVIAELLQPFMPGTAEKIKAAVRENKVPETLFARKE